MLAGKRRARLVSLLSGSLIAAALLSSPTAAAAETSVSAATGPPTYGPIVIRGEVRPVLPDGTLGQALPTQQGKQDPSDEQLCPDGSEATDPIGTQNTDTAACVMCLPSRACWVEYLVAHGPFTTTFVASHVATGNVAVLGPTLYICNDGCVLRQGGGGIGWQALWWAVSSDTGAGIIRHWCA